MPAAFFVYGTPETERAGAMRLWGWGTGESGTAATPRWPAEFDPGTGALPLLVREHSAARRITLRFSADGAGLRLTVPPRTARRTVLDFLDRHRAWVAERAERVSPATAVADGTVLPVAGRPVRVRWEAGARRLAALRETAEGEVLLVGGPAEAAGRRVEEFLRREARRELEAAVARHAATVGLAPAAITLRDTRSRWGSCTHDRRLSFSFRIAMAPPFALDYLAAHEVAHFREMNHGPRFWALCDRLCPDGGRGRLWLKGEGAALHRWRFR